LNLFLEKTIEYINLKMRLEGDLKNLDEPGRQARANTGEKSN